MIFAIRRFVLYVKNYPEKHEDYRTPRYKFLLSISLIEYGSDKAVCGLNMNQLSTVHRYKGFEELLKKKRRKRERRER